jgi:hypothetical protein
MILHVFPLSYLSRRVLEEIQVVVEKRLPSTTPPTRKRDKISGWLRKTGKDVFLSEKIEEEIQEMRRKLQEVVEEFEVRGSVRQVWFMLSTVS